MTPSIFKRSVLLRDLHSLVLYVSGPKGQTFEIHAFVGKEGFDVLLVKEDGRLSSLPTYLTIDVEKFLLDESKVMKAGGR